MNDLITVGMDKLGWHERFIQALKSETMNLNYKLVNMESPDWIKDIQDADAVLWKPHYMGIKSASYFKEKVYFMQHIAGKRVFPNYESIWHFESKAAQHYLFRHHGIKTPETVVFMDENLADEILDRCSYPVVFKQSDGAAAKNVELINTRRSARARLQRQFAVPLYENLKREHGSRRAGLSVCFRRWFWSRTWQRLHAPFETSALACLQQFMKKNPADLRVTVIGDRYAYAFWRKNRRHDFRASGSGIIDYEKPVPPDIIRYCLALNKTLHFDSMCYDILFDADDFVIAEMSYGYKDRPLYEAGGYYTLDETGLQYLSDACWPQTLWVKWMLLSLDKQESHAD